jgi:hypothetical protein
MGIGSDDQLAGTDEPFFDRKLVADSMVTQIEKVFLL